MKHISSWNAFTFGIKATIKNPILLAKILLVSPLFFAVGFLIVLAVVIPISLFLFFVISSTTKISFDSVGYIAAHLSMRLGVPLIFLTLFFCFKKVVLDIVDNKKPSAFSIFLPRLIANDLITGGMFLGVLFFLLYFLGDMVYSIFVCCVGRSPESLNIDFALLYLLFMSLAFSSVAYLFLKFYFFPYFIIDKNLGVIKSFKKSFCVQQGTYKLFQLVCIHSLFVFLPCVVFSKVYRLLFPADFWLLGINIICLLFWVFSFSFSEAYLYRKLTSSK